MPFEQLWQVIDAYEEIRSWLNSRRDFMTGVNLYRLYGDQPWLKDQLGRGKPTREMREKLFDALKGIFFRIKEKRLQQSNAEATDSAVTVAAATTRIEAAEEKYIEARGTNISNNIKETSAYQQLDLQWRPIYHEMNMLFNRLDLLKDGSSECEAACLRILDLEQQCIKIWEKKDYLVEHGRLPEERKDMNAGEAANLHRELTNLRTRRTKANKAMKMLEGRKLEKKKAVLNEITARIFELEKILEHE